MELNHLRYFYEVARRQSFTKASAALRVSQPSISRTIKQMEDTVGARLLDRTRRGGVSLTDTGKLFFQSCESIFQEVDNLKLTVQQRDAEVAGDLSIGASDNICNYLFPDVLEEFFARHPKVRVQLFNGSSGDIKGEILAGKSELGVFHTPPTEPAIEAEKIAFVEFAIVGSPANKELLKLSKRFEPERLAALPFVSCRTSDYSKPYPIRKMLKSIDITPTVHFESNSQETQKRMALKGLGYAILPRYMVADELRAKRLVEIRTPKRLGADIYLACKKNKTLSKPAQVFGAHLKAKLKDSMFP
ncbi:MAG: LysR family transcriptional regulator [Deltaproteobacteria bacterium]|nr:LysR family transcriptional regulator [Deltaproteobacteria bacterium]